MLVYYFVPFIVSNRYFLFWVSNGHNSVTVQNRTHAYMNFFHHKDLGNHLLQLCPKVVKHPVYSVCMCVCVYIYIYSSTVHIYTQTIHRTTQVHCRRQYTWIKPLMKKVFILLVLHTYVHCQPCLFTSIVLIYLIILFVNFTEIL